MVIPTLNQNGLLGPCLDSLAEFSDAAETIVIYNGHDATPKKYRPSVSHFIFRENEGFAKASNKGAELAATPYVLFLNDDTEVHPGFLKPLVDLLDTEPTMAAVGSQLLYPDGTIQHSGVYFTYDTWSGILAGNHYHDDRKAGQVGAVTAACMLVRKSMFDQVGGFDEGYVNGNEDVDLCLRFREAGLGVYFQPTSIVTHHESASGPERWAHVGENIRRLSDRWGPMFATLTTGS